MSATGRPAPEVEALAADLDAVLFGHARNPAPTARVDSALVDALDGVRWLLETSIATADDVTPTTAEIARVAFDLLVDARHGRIPRPFVRLVAGTAFVHVGARSCLHPSAEPLLTVLAALAALPVDTDEAPSLEAQPDPGCRVEHAIAATLRDPAARPALLDALRAESLQVPVLGVDVGGEAAQQRAEVQLLPVVVRGRPAIAAYTSTSRIEEHARAADAGEVPALLLRGAELARVVPAGHGLVVNPGSLLGLGLSETEVRSLDDRRPGGQPGGSR